MPKEVVYIQTQQKFKLNLKTYLDLPLLVSCTEFLAATVSPSTKSGTRSKHDMTRYAAGLLDVLSERSDYFNVTDTDFPRLVRNDRLGA